MKGRNRAHAPLAVDLEPGTILHTALPDVAPLPLVFIPAGTFLLGSPDGVGSRWERPRLTVRISRPFLAGVTPITQAQWRALADAAGLPPSPSRTQGDTHPVDRVSWNQAVRWCNALSAFEQRPTAYTLGTTDPEEVRVDLTIPGYRLPTDAEWEYLCRAGTDTRWSFGEDESALQEHVWVPEGGGITHPVGQKRPNPWGLHDVHGHVWEWCGDRPYRDASTQPVEDPFRPPDIGGARGIRGGGLGRSAALFHAGPDDRAPTLGFRVVLPLPRGL